MSQKAQFDDTPQLTTFRVRHSRGQKNVTTSSRHNSEIHESILIIFATYITEEVGNQKVRHFPTSPN